MKILSTEYKPGDSVSIAFDDSDRVQDGIIEYREMIGMSDLEIAIHMLEEKIEETKGDLKATRNRFASYCCHYGKLVGFEIALNILKEILDTGDGA